MRLLIAIATISTLALSGCLDAVGGVDGSSGRTVVRIDLDDEAEMCYHSSSYGVSIWAINGGDCDCPSGFTPVGFLDNATVCLEDE